MKQAALFTLAAVGVGFLVGFVWGAGTREALPSATETDFSDGVLTVRVRAAAALKQGLSAVFG